jgi:hypothetical protein
LTPLVIQIHGIDPFEHSYSKNFLRDLAMSTYKRGEREKPCLKPLEALKEGWVFHLSEEKYKG